MYLGQPVRFKKLDHTYMHDRGPPMNDILQTQTKLATVRYWKFRSRISIYALDIRPRNALGKWSQPALGFPFGRIGPPNR